jgi:hypothetical protein
VLAARAWEHRRSPSVPEARLWRELSAGKLGVVFRRQVVLGSAIDLGRVRFLRFLPPSDVNDELFFVEQDRTVLADNTFSLKNTRFEAPRDLRSRKVQIRFDRLKFDRALVYFKGERMGEARPVDFVGNDRKPSRRSTATEPERGREGEVQP